MLWQKKQQQQQQLKWIKMVKVIRHTVYSDLDILHVATFVHRYQYQSSSLFFFSLFGLFILLLFCSHKKKQLESVRAKKKEDRPTIETDNNILYFGPHTLVISRVLTAFTQCTFL